MADDDHNDDEEQHQIIEIQLHGVILPEEFCCAEHGFAKQFRSRDVIDTVWATGKCQIVSEDISNQSKSNANKS